MTATNHAITGAIIAVTIDKPVIALPLALLSHFVTDMLPHFGYKGHLGYGEKLKRKLAVFMMVIDPIAFIPFIALLLAHHVSFWIYAAAFLALAPDFHDFIAHFVFKKPKQFNWFSRMASKIQWCERPWGAFVELAWYIGGLIILVKLLT